MSPPPASTGSTGPRAWSGLALVCAAAVVWGTIGPAVDVAHERSSLSALVIGAYRAVAGFGVLALAATVAHRWPACLALVRAHRGRIVLTGVLTALFQLSFFVAVLLVGVSVTTVVALGFAPVLLLVLAAVQRRALPAVGEALPVTAAVLGVVLVGTGGVGGAGATHVVTGMLAALGSGAAFALATHVGRSLTGEHDALAVTTCTTAVVAAVLVPGGLGLAALRGESLQTSDVGTWALVAYLGVVTMALAYVLLYAGLRSTASGTVVVATLLEPVTAVVIAALFLGERLSLAGAIGCLLILGAITALGRRPGPVPPTSPGTPAVVER